ncbi:MAG TPA: 16S rRNA (guanine(966)-N(2))-methyltransferase RsmD [Longimicrobiales bacterium]|nr:16S rRNA (guanine(966)-N(2))-methyltransferase RsmD [Longimicrobiales bacterium]
MRIIAGRWRGHNIAAPPGEKTRPTTDRVREAWMSALQHDLPDARVLDLFAGSGALGLEALSRGAAHVTFVEKAAGPLRALTSNVEKLGAAKETEVVKADALRYVETLSAAEYDIAFADPPYDSGAAAHLIQAFVATAFSHILTVEHRSREALPQVDGARTRRYGDTAITFITAPQ